MFSHHASVLRIGKNPIIPLLFAQSVMLSVLSVPIGCSMLCFLATTTECLQAKPSVGSSWDGPVYSAATFPATVSSQFKLDLKQRVTTKMSWSQRPQRSCFSSDSHATANVSLLARWQKLPTATLITNKWRVYCSVHWCLELSLFKSKTSCLHYISLSQVLGNLIQIYSYQHLPQNPHSTGP